MMLLKKPVYDKFFTKVNTIIPKEFVLKTQYNTDKLDLEKKIDDADKKIRDTYDRIVKKDRLKCYYH